MLNADNGGVVVLRQLREEILNEQCSAGRCKLPAQVLEGVIHSKRRSAYQTFENTTSSLQDLIQSTVHSVLSSSSSEGSGGSSAA